MSDKLVEQVARIKFPSSLGEPFEQEIGTALAKEIIPIIAEEIKRELPKNPHFSRKDTSDYGLGLMNGYDQALKDMERKDWLKEV